MLAAAPVVVSTDGSHLVKGPNPEEAGMDQYRGSSAGGRGFMEAVSQNLGDLKLKKVGLVRAS